jgi:hypothetical protein
MLQIGDWRMLIAKLGMTPQPEIYSHLIHAGCDLKLLPFAFGDAACSICDCDLSYRFGHLCQLRLCHRGIQRERDQTWIQRKCAWGLILREVRKIPVCRMQRNRDEVYAAANFSLSQLADELVTADIQLFKI